MYYMWNKASNDNKVLQQTADSLCHDFLINRPKHAYKMTRTFALTKCSPAHDTKREEDLSRNKIAVASRTNDDNIAAVVTGQRALSKIFQISLWIINIILFQIFIFFSYYIFSSTTVEYQCTTYFQICIILQIWIWILSNNIVNIVKQSHI